MEQEIMNLIVAITPALTSIIGIISAVATMIKKVKKIDNDHSVETKKLNAKMDIVLTENAELKRELNKVLKKIHHVKDE